MKKLFQIIGIISLLGISFFYTEKTINVVKEYDDIMIEIKEKNKEYKKEYKNAIIKKDTIIPGNSGVEIDLNKSYSKMRKYGSFNESLIVLKKIKPKISIKNNKDKYIINGNKNKKNVTLIFFVNNDIDELINILDKKQVKGNIFIDNKWLERYTNIAITLVKENHNIGLIDQTKDSYEWSSNIIKKVGKQSNIYCYFNKKNKNNLKICSDYKILPNIKIDKNPYEKTKLYLANGSIISYKVSNQLLEELPIIISYIKSKGYDIVNLDKLIEE